MSSVGELSLSGQKLYVTVNGGNITIGDYVRTTQNNSPLNNRLVIGINVESLPRGNEHMITVLTSNNGKYSPQTLRTLT